MFCEKYFPPNSQGIGNAKAKAHLAMHTPKALMYEKKSKLEYEIGY